MSAYRTSDPVLRPTGGELFRSDEVWHRWSLSPKDNRLLGKQVDDEFVFVRQSFRLSLRAVFCLVRLQLAIACIGTCGGSIEILCGIVSAELDDWLNLFIGHFRCIGFGRLLFDVIIRVWLS
jgi:hypothetical protein